MRNPLLVPEFREMLEAGQTVELRDFCEECHPATVAEMVSALDPDEIWKLISLANAETRTEIFTHIDEDVQDEIVEKLPRNEIGRLFSDMPPDDRAKIFRRLPDEKQDFVLPAMAKAEREDIRKLSAYEEGTAGAIMTTDYVTLNSSTPVPEALELLRKTAPDEEAIYSTYVVDSDRRLLGEVSLSSLVMAPRTKTIADIMEEEVIYSHVNDDQEDVAHKIQKYDMLAIPIINENGAIVGIVTADDAIDVITQENTEDMEKLMAIGGSHEAGSYLRSTPWEHFRNRAPWVAALGIVGLLSGYIIQHFEGLLGKCIILAAFMPMLAGAGGNTGSQSASLIVRGLATQELSLRDIPKILLKEALVSLMLGVLLGAIVFARVFIQGETGAGSYPLGRIGLAIATAVGLQVVTATIIGAMLPVAAAKMKFDPAVVASPALATIVDVTGLLIYFSVAKIMLGV